MLEIADLIAVNKADGDGADRARKAAGQYRAALDILAPANPVWKPPVITMSGLTGEGLDGFWEQIVTHRQRMEASGQFASRRADQNVQWMHTLVREHWLAAMTQDPDIRTLLNGLEADVREGTVNPSLAAEQLMSALLNHMHAP